MSIVVEHTVQAMMAVVQTVPVGTNLALLRLLWVMMSGGFLASRGAVFGALAEAGLSAEEVRRSWAALRQGAWKIEELLESWEVYVASENRWRQRRHGKYSVLSVDMTGFLRPRLKGWMGSHFYSMAQRALPAVVFGVVVMAGEVEGKRTPLLQRVVRCQPETDKKDFRRQLLKEACKVAGPGQVLVMDAEFTLCEIHEEEVKHYVVRMATNCTLRRSVLPPRKGRGRKPKFGAYVRPLARQRQGRTLDGSPADAESKFVYQGRIIKVRSWHNLVTSKTALDAAPDAALTTAPATFSIHTFTDPSYQQPLVLATNLTDCQPETAYLIYRDRWTVEQTPLAAKQMVGLHRQFVFAPESCFRLPELSLLAGTILAYVAAVAPPIPSGFWDRSPARSPGRLRRLLRSVNFLSLPLDDPQLRKKNSVTAHLPKGIHAHRRSIADSLPSVTGN